MNTTKIVRSKRDKENPFTRIANSILNLKADEVGIMLQILSNSDSWVINKDVVWKRSKLGERRFDRAWNHLKGLGYIEVEKRPMKNGKFCYHYIIHEVPGIQNGGTDIKPEVHFGGMVDKTRPTLPGGGKPGLVNGGTNNYYITNTNSNNPDGSNSRKGVEVRPDQKILDPKILDLDNNSQIVPHPSLCLGEVRDNEKGQHEGPNMISPTHAPINTIPITPANAVGEQTKDQNISFSSEFCYSGKNKISDEVQEIIDNLEIIPKDDLKKMIHIFYEENIPNWDALLKKKQLHYFLKDTAKLGKPDVLTIELLTEYHNRLKKETYKKY